MLIAAAQVTPVFLDRDRTIDKCCRVIADAAARGVKLVLFPESFIPAYPDWVWVVPAGRGPMFGDLHRRLLENSVAIPDDVTRLREAAASAACIVAVGVTEREGTALYNTLLVIGADGSILGRHRKLVPTGGERLVWAPGDATGLKVHDTPIGRLGGLICWENYMPLARYALFAGGVQIYLAPTWDYGEAWMATLRHIAREGRAFVIGCSMPLRLEDIPPQFEFRSLYPEGREWINPGGSAIIGPKGNILAGPVEKKEEIVIADIDLAAATAAKWDLDLAGHYSRPDIFDLTIDRDARPFLRERE